ncbi:SIMPL domain-containing protein [Cytophaga sp. FL35]|uniref:SIMPL domain-containing protein n=1 Tax=Cytophaga sp. FL35 TaxID=1904456 RepID=UPI0016538392|nr:SIMPL domain-containing protein [Cytophaga sp. FL35]MBC6998590.1 SIMPL domain-containing protein [Cytophaga sp. FL35]
MKKLFLSIAFTFISLLTLQAQTDTNSITVNGTYQYSMSPEYISKMIVSLNNVYYDAQTISISEVKSGYYDKLEKAGISSSTLKEDLFAYNLLGYEKEGTIVEFRTKSIDEMKKFLSVKSLGVSRSESSLEFELDPEQAATYAEKAFESAKKKANAIATKVGRKIGKAIMISDTNYSKIQESLYYGNIKNNREYYISVTFELL